MHVRLNGESHTLPDGIRIHALLEQLKLDSSRVAVELNTAIVPRSLYNGTELKEGDRLEIVRFIGGG